VTFTYSGPGLGPGEGTVTRRGRTVVDRHRDEVGRVEDLLVDERENRVRFLRVGEGGFLGPELADVPA